MDYISISEVAEKWNITPRRIQVLCNEGRIKGAKKIANVWLIPSNATKPHPANKKKIVDTGIAEYEGRVKLRNLVKKRIPEVINMIKNQCEESPRDIILIAYLYNIVKSLGLNPDTLVPKLCRKTGLSMVEDENYQVFCQTCDVVKMDSIELIDIPNIISWVYQYLNKYLDDNRFYGTQFFTEEYMVQFLIDSVNVEESLDGKVVDICCGGGNFLTFALLKKLSDPIIVTKETVKEAVESLYGYDLDSSITRIAYVNILLTVMVYCYDKDIKLDDDFILGLSPNLYYSSDDSPSGSLDSSLKIYRVDDRSGKQYEMQLALGKADYLFTNPPFATIKGMDSNLKDYIKKYFPKSNCDLSAAFLEQSFRFVKESGRVGIVAQNSWMFLDSLTAYRKQLLNSIKLTKILDLGSSAFVDLNGEKSSVALIIGENKKVDNNHIRYASLSRCTFDEKVVSAELLKDATSEEWTNIALTEVLDNENYRLDFMNVGGFRAFYYSNRKYKEAALPMQGTSTGNSKEYVGYFWEHFNDPEWRLVSKGGGYCRWRGLNRYVLRWGRDGDLIKRNKGSVIRNASYFDQTELVFSDTGTSGLNCRLLLPNQLFIASGPGIRILKGNKFAHLAYLNSRVASYYIQMLTPKLTIAAGYIAKLPIDECMFSEPALINLGKICCDLKEHILIYRPNNYEYSASGFVLSSNNLRENAIDLFRDDIFTYLQILEAESKIDDYIIDLMNLSKQDIKNLDAQMGENPFAFEVNRSIESTVIDKTISSALDICAFVKKNKVGTVRYGADNFLEYLSRLTRINPRALYQLIMKDIKLYDRTLAIYENIILHNLVLNCFGYSPETGVSLRALSIGKIVDEISSSISDASEQIEEWIRHSFEKTHISIFFGCPILYLKENEVLVR